MWEIFGCKVKSCCFVPSAVVNGNVSLDVLPVKGPQGPALRVTEPPLKVVNPFLYENYCFSMSADILFPTFFMQASEALHKQSESWTIYPEQLVLAAPTISESNQDFVHCRRFILNAQVKNMYLFF